MPRTEIPVVEIDRDGVEPPLQIDSDQTNGMYLSPNSGRIFVEIESTDAGAQSVGFAIPETIDGQAVSDRTVDVPAGEVRLAGPFPQVDYNQDDNSLHINPSIDSTLKLRAYKLPGS